MLLKFFSLYFILSSLFPNEKYMINEIANKSGIYYSKVDEDLLITGGHIFSILMAEKCIMDS